MQELPAIELLAPCAEPVVPAKRTNGDMATYIADLRGSLRTCNTDKAGLREWYEKVTKP